MKKIFCLISVCVLLLLSAVTASAENVSKFISPLGSVISTVPNFIIGFVVSAVATCFMTATFDDIKDFIIRQFNEENQYKVRRAKYILLSSVK